MGNFETGGEEVDDEVEDRPPFVLPLQCSGVSSTRHLVVADLGILGVGLILEILSCVSSIRGHPYMTSALRGEGG